MESHPREGTPALQFSIHTVTATEYYLITGSAIARFSDPVALYALASAAARSVQLTEP